MGTYFNQAPTGVVQRCNATVVDLSDDSTVVTSSPALLIGVYVNTVLSAHVCLIRDGDVTGTVKVRLPASLAAGSEKDFKGAIFDSGITVDPDNAATGEVCVLWMPRD